MSMNEPRSIHALEDWGVVLQSVPSKHRKEIVKRLQEIFGLDKHDAEQALANMPLILVDNISFGLAARIKKFFQGRGAVAETTNHDMIKKNCFQIVWPQTPDLSFFLLEETKSTDASVQPGTSETKSAPEQASLWKTHTGLSSETPGTHPAPVPVSWPQPVVSKIPPETPVPEKPVRKSPAVVPQVQPIFEEKPAAVSSFNIDSDWARRTDELNEKLRKIQKEKQQLHDQHTETTEKVKMEFQQQLDKEKQKSEKIAHAYEELQEEARKQEALTQEGFEWKSKAMVLGEKVRALETDLTQKISTIEHLILQKDDLTRDAEKAAELTRRVSDLERVIAEKDREKAAIEKRAADLDRERSALGEKVRALETDLMQKISTIEHLILQKDDLTRDAEKAAELAGRVSDLERVIAEKDQEKAALEKRAADLDREHSGAQREIASLQSREKEWTQKAGALERSVQEMTESLRARDGVLAQFEKQVQELDEKAREYEVLRQESALLVQECATIRKEYDAKIEEQEVHLAKVEEDHRRYRSRVDRKTAAATRELGEWIRRIDPLRQGLQKLILFLGSESAVLDTEKESSRRSPLNRSPDTPDPEKS